MAARPTLPPRLAEWFLTRWLPTGLSSDGVVGDLREEYRQRRHTGRWRADRWYWRQTLSLIVRFTKHRAGQRRRRGDAMLPQLRQDLRHAIRLLIRSPGFSAVAILTMTLGIGSTTAIASVVRHVLLRPLPYETPERVVQLLGTQRGVVERGTISYLDFIDLRERLSSFAGLAAFDEWAPTFQTDDGAERIPAASVNAAFFEVLGVQAARGRFFLPEEDQPGHEPVVVVSHRFWGSRMGADPAAIGRSIELPVRPTRWWALRPRTSRIRSSRARVGSPPWCGGPPQPTSTGFAPPAGDSRS